MNYDAQRLEITATDTNAVNVINDFIDNCLSFNRDIAQILKHADSNPDCAMMQIYASVLYVLSQSKHDALPANRYLDNALNNYDQLLPREQLWLQAVQASLENRFDDALSLYELILQRWPTDLIAAKLLAFHCFETGIKQRQLQSLKSIQTANQDNPYYLAMLAFTYELNGHSERCIELANRAIELKSHNPWAFHALAHAYTSIGQYHNGIRILREAEPIWTSGNRFIRSHMGFHLAALYLTELDFDNAERVYHQYIWCKQPKTIYEQTDAILLLWYMELAGHPLQNDWQQLAPFIESRAYEFNFPFLNVLYIYALQRAGKAQQANDALRAMRLFAAEQSGRDAERWQRYGLPLASACLAFAEKDFQQASELLANTHDITAAGGSDEQLGVLWQSYLTSLIESQQDDKAKQLLQAMSSHTKTHSRLQQRWQQQLNS